MWKRLVLFVLTPLVRVVREIWEMIELEATEAECIELEKRVEAAEKSEPLDLRACAEAAGLIDRDQFVGLGSTAIEPGTEGHLAHEVTESLWAKRVVLDATELQGLTVERVTIGGVPYIMGAGMPLSAFLQTTPTNGFILGREQALSAGQRIQIDVQNHTQMPVVVCGVVVCDRMNPIETQMAWERMLGAGSENANHPEG